jgi:nitrite reductase/ring-hydroxylating ferredoxin subunit
MLSREENDLVTRVGPGTPMGEVLRRYWIPGPLSRELPAPDCEPVRVKLLGENLVAFRDSSGRVGMLDESCPHRLASLWFGRNEENGLRCVYHGWKFDVDGNCLEQMNEPIPFTDKVRATSYPTVELGGIIWTYMGAREKMPPPPQFEWAMAPDSHRHCSKVIEECNWLQALEGGIDTSHAPILHRNLSVNSKVPGVAFNSPFVQGKAPTLEVDFTDYGYRYFGVRELREGGKYVRGYHYVMPWTQLRPAQFQGDRSGESIREYGPGHFWVPMDDYTTMVYNFMYSYGSDPGISELERLEKNNGNGPEYVDPTTFRSFANAANNYRIDRDVQRTETFSGIPGVNTQDRALQETMGRIVDRSREKLGPADKAIIATRRLLLDAIKTVESGGDPPGTGNSYYSVRAIERIVPDEQAWQDVMLPLMYPAAARELEAVG